MNPKAQNVTRRRRRAVAAALGMRFDVEERATERRGHGVELAREAVRRGFDLVVSLGGDGTANEVANGLAETDVPLAVLPAGGANVLARALGGSNDLAQATRALVEEDRKPRRISLGRVGDRYFTCNCGVGLDAAIVRSVERHQRLKRLFGDWLFVALGLGVFATGFDRRRPHVQIESADGEARRLFFAIVQKTDPLSFLGRRPLRVCPDASFERGLDCLGLDTMDAPTVLSVLISAFGSATHTGNPHVTYLRDQPRVRIRCNRPMPVQADGEFIGERTDVVVEAVPEALSVIC